MRKILTLLTVITLLGISSCKEEETKDPAICDLDWETETEAEYDALVAAYYTYAADLSAENCNLYKEAFVDYIAALEPFLECTSWLPADLQELKDVIDESEDAMNQLNCE